MSYAENLGPPYLLSDGFTGLGNLGDGENLDYAFDVILSAETVPEPATFGTALLLLIGMCVCKFTIGGNK